MLLPVVESLVYKSYSPDNVFCYTPHLIILESGRMLLTMDLGGEGLCNSDAVKLHSLSTGTTRIGLGKVFLSDTAGRKWNHVEDFGFWHARLFSMNKKLYIIGNAGDLCIISSEDDGKTWGRPSILTHGERWHSSACNVCCSNDAIYLAMEKRFYTNEIKGWNVAGLSPILLTCKNSDNPISPESWRQSSSFVYRDRIENRFDYFGMPFWPTNDSNSVELMPRRNNAPAGWLEANVIQIEDKNHLWYDEAGKTFHLFLRAHTGGANYACVLKTKEEDDGTLITDFQKTPAGKKHVYIPFPGGHLKFFMLYDEKSELYWLISNQAYDSMRTLESLDSTVRYGLPNNERHRLQLLFSKNCMDWCLAGMIACARNEYFSRCYPSMAIHENDLHIVARAADHEAKDPQYSNCIVHYSLRDFRKYAY